MIGLVRKLDRPDGPAGQILAPVGRVARATPLSRPCTGYGALSGARAGEYQRAKTNQRLAIDALETSPDARQGVPSMQKQTASNDEAARGQQSLTRSVQKR